jgi:N6-L-threonylcarbamoyladenine synthase
MSASFQRTVCETLAIRLREAFDEYQPNSVVIAGGVAANSKLKLEVTKRLPIDITYAPIELCTDNAAMIASMGYFLSKSGRTVNPYTLKADPNLAI